MHRDAGLSGFIGFSFGVCKPCMDRHPQSWAFEESLARRGMYKPTAEKTWYCIEVRCSSEQTYLRFRGAGIMLGHVLFGLGGQGLGVYG